MPVLTAPVGQDGPVVLIAVLISQPRTEALRAAGLPVPPPQVVHALIDTGASCSAIDLSVIQALALSPTGRVPIHTPSTGTTPHSCDLYDVALAVLMGAHTQLLPATFPVLGAQLASQGIEALIGRDVLSLGALWYNGQDNTLSLAF